MIMTEFKLQIFYRVATEKSFSRAAEEMFISQPAVTKQIKSLETELGIILFERGTKKVELTSGGRIFLRHATAILSQFKRLRNDLSLLSEQLSGKLVIGASTTIAQYVLPPVLAQFQKTNPSLKITLLNENSTTIEKLLDEGKIDLGIIEGLPDSSSLKYTLFTKDELVLIAHRTSRYSEITDLSLKDLAQYDLVLREKGSGTLEVFEDYLEKHGYNLGRFNVLMQLGSTESIKLFLKHTDALGVISIHAMTDSLISNEFSLIGLEEGRIYRNFYFVHSKRRPDKIVTRFMSFLSNNYNHKL